MPFSKSAKEALQHDQSSKFKWNKKNAHIYALSLWDHPVQSFIKIIFKYQLMIL